MGAGLAGLVAAYELMELGLRPVVYEPTRIGGRLRSHEFEGADGVVAELGGMRFPVSGTSFFHYADRTGLASAPFPNPLTEAAGSTVIDIAGTDLPRHAPSVTCRQNSPRSPVPGTRRLSRSASAPCRTRSVRATSTS